MRYMDSKFRLRAWRCLKLESLSRSQGSSIHICTLRLEFTVLYVHRLHKTKMDVPDAREESDVLRHEHIVASTV